MTSPEARLFHISEQAGISRFEPRPAPHPSARLQDDVVWAVDGDHLPNYLLPRDCPRVTFRVGPASTPEDVTALLSAGGSRHVVAVESRWLDRIRAHRVVRYEFDPGPFQLQDAAAGYWVSRQVVLPRAEVQVEDLLGALLQHDVELRLLQSLWRLREAVIHSSLEFSIIRMRNAIPPPEGLAEYHPLP